MLSFATSVAIVGVLLDGLNTYRRTRGVKQAFRNGDGGGIMDVWPQVMEVRPTVLMVSVAGVAGGLSAALGVGSWSREVSLVSFCADGRCWCAWWMMRWIGMVVAGLEAC